METFRDDVPLNIKDIHTSTCFCKSRMVTPCGIAVKPSLEVSKSDNFIGNCETIEFQANRIDELISNRINVGGCHCEVRLCISLQRRKNPNLTWHITATSPVNELFK
ncbi:unnamed protein product [Trichobilharzia szidati]|nr:unnamed protein product [Trichobilharzia szidati]